MSDPVHPFFPPDGSALAGLMRAHDWSQSPLGPPEGWPQNLRTLVGVMLGSHQPMFVAWGPERAILYNDSYADLLALRHPSALGRPFAEVWFDIMDVIDPIMDRAFAGEGTHMEDIAFTMHRRGYPEEAHFSFSYTPVRGESGEVEGMFCACTETTEVVAAGRKRIAETEALRQLFAKAPGFMAVMRGRDMVFEMVNDSYRQLIGHRQVEGKPIREALPEIAGQGFFELLDDVYRSGRPFAGASIEIDIERSPGGETEQRLVDFVYQPIIAAGGEVTGIFVEGYDVTERHRAQLALAESEHRFRLIADSAPVPMWVTKLDRSRGFVNLAYAAFLGVSYEEALHFDWRTIVHPDDAERLLRASLAGEATLKPFRLEARYRRHDGEWRWLRSESQPRLGLDGEHVGFIGVATDITGSKRAEAALRQMNELLENKVEEGSADLMAAMERLQTEIAERERAEEQLRQAQKMEAVGQLTGGIAHDFNNLLTPIMGGLEIIAARLDDPRLKRMAEAALESTRRGAKLTGQLLAFSRIQRISMNAVDVNAVVERMSDLLRHTIGAEIALATELSGDRPHALCDANQLENAILNLAINARDAMAPGGRVTIRTAREAVTECADLPSGDYVAILVEDDGHGMTPEVAARATEPFFSTKPTGKGTGLGLAQVYGIARQSGGMVRIESAPGEGTLVRILLPATETQGAEAQVGDADAVEPAPPARGGTILVVDDDPDVRDFLADALAGMGYEVVTATSGEQALERVGAARPALVLVDYAMPGMNGAELALAARESAPGLPVVFVTGYAETEQLEAAVGPHAPVLRKPFTLGALASIVEQNIAGPGTPPDQVSPTGS